MKCFFQTVPTFAEAGVQGVELNSWVGVLAPAHTPEEIIRQLNVEINAVLSEPEVKTQLQGYGIIEWSEGRMSACTRELDVKGRLLLCAAANPHSMQG